MSAGRATRFAFFAMVTPAIALYTFFFVVPAISGIFYSLTDWNGIAKSYNFIGLRNYANLFTDARVRNAVWFTMTYTVCVVAATIGISLGAALLLNVNVRGKGIFRSVYFFPAVLSLLTVGLIFNQIFYKPLPLIGQALGISWLSNNILGNPKLAWIGILITNVWQGVSMPTVIFMAGITSIPGDLFESATMDGAGAVKRFLHITLPFLIPMLSINLVMAIRGGLTVFDYIKTMTDGGPGSATESIGIMIFKLGFSQFKFGYGAAQSIALLVLIALISVAQNLLLRRKEVGQL